MSYADGIFSAILAMDAYNHGNGAGVRLDDSSPVGFQIGNAAIYDNATDSSFYAVAYSLNSGGKIISYRGTDNTSTDLFAFPMAIGNYNVLQAYAASAFYLEQAELFGVGNVTLTGHSLGGGLAGFISAVYGSSATIFDNMPFEAAAENLGDAISSGSNTIYTNLFFGPTIDPSPSLSRGNINGYYIEGEFLSTLRGGQISAVEQLTLGTGIDLPGVDSGVLGGNLHSISLLVIGLFGKAYHDEESWREVSKYVLPSLFDDTLAIATGAEQYQGSASPSNVMRDAIAYSAIEDGFTIFGDTGVNSFFNDANDLGDATSVSDVSTTLQAAAGAIGKILVQYAGQIAIGKVSRDETPEALEGVLEISSDKSILAVDFSEPLWEIGRGEAGATANIIGRRDLTDNVLREAGWSTSGTAPNDIRTGMRWLWNDETSEIIDRIEFATQNGALTATLTERTIPSSKVTLFAAAGSNDTITGSRDNNFIFGGDGDDELHGGEGDDLLAGGDGDDRLSGGEGRDFFAGGAGTDTVFFGDIGPSDFINLTLRAHRESAGARSPPRRAMAAEGERASPW
jgi:Ca2+-binding RTX toxin-like protein